ncbi:MAG: ATP-binding protein [Elusimicrobiota bacterium]
MEPQRLRPPRGRNVRPRGAPASSVPSLVKDLVDQFDEPLNFFRELIQNAIDAGSNRVDVSLEHDGARALIRVEDDGEGMDEYIIDNFLLVLFRSTKEDDYTKIGKFGIGFVSVFALRPDLVRVRTARNGESWRIDFPDYRRYEKYRLSEMREGTLVELTKTMDRPRFEKLAKDARDTIRYWCKHSEARIYFRVGGPDAAPEIISEPFGLGGASLTHKEEGTRIEIGFTADKPPFYGFYNRGLTLKEGSKEFFAGVAFKAKSRYLEHTLTRDNVMDDENFRKLMGILEALVERKLPARLRVELRTLAAEISRLASRFPSKAGSDGTKKDPELARLSGRWGERLPYLEWLLSGHFSRWWRSDWAVYPGLSGKPLTYARLEDGVSEAGGKLYFDDSPNRITRALENQGISVLPAGPWVEPLARWLGAEAAKASGALIQPRVIADQKLAAPMRSFLATLRALDERSGSKYRGIAAADLAYPASPLKGQMFVTQKEPGALSPANARPVSSLFRGRSRRWALLHLDHPATEKLRRLHVSRPGFAAYLCLKMMHLKDGDVPADRASEFSNLAEKAELKLLSVALDIDSASKCRL